MDIKDIMEYTNQIDLPFVNREPNANEFEKFRLAISTFQDGTGQNHFSDGAIIPGWRDFERTIADCFNGVALEGKSIFDVIVPNSINNNLYYGISCKMSKVSSAKGVQSLASQEGRVRMELTNAHAKFWAHLNKQGIYVDNYKHNPQKTGHYLLDLIHIWHNNSSDNPNITFDIDGSSYLVLSWDTNYNFQLHWYSFKLPNSDSLHWEAGNKAIRALDSSGTIIEWYGESGGQMKYYPLTKSALWASPSFRLEPLHEKDTPSKKAARYFPERWKLTQIGQ